MLILADSIEKLLEMPNLLFVIGGVIAVVAIISGSITSIVTTRSRERTRREIAAYVAEGSIQPEQAVAMLKAGRGAGECV